MRECLALTPNPIPGPKQPSIELKQLPKNLIYEFLGEEQSPHVIVNADLTLEETGKLLKILRKYPEALGYNIYDLKGISPSICMHIILLEEDSKPSREHQRRINPILSTSLDSGIIYPISDSKWVRPVHVVPKKGGVTVVQNEKGESVTMRKQSGWRMFINYRKLNKATRRSLSPSFHRSNVGTPGLTFLFLLS